MTVQHSESLKWKLLNREIQANNNINEKLNLGPCVALRVSCLDILPRFMTSFHNLWHPSTIYDSLPRTFQAIKRWHTSHLNCLVFLARVYQRFICFAQEMVSESEMATYDYWSLMHAFVINALWDPVAVLYRDKRPKSLWLDRRNWETEVLSL